MQQSSEIERVRQIALRTTLGLPIPMDALSHHRCRAEARLSNILSRRKAA
jgi:hypothetical protein